jgi:hypothetical protein
VKHAPNGAEIVLQAAPNELAPTSGASAGSVKRGPHTGSIRGGGQGVWKASWRAEEHTYTLEFVPVEGGSATLNEFKDLLGTLHWN